MSIYGGHAASYLRMSFAEEEPVPNWEAVDVVVSKDVTVVAEAPSFDALLQSLLVNVAALKERAAASDGQVAALKERAAASDGQVAALKERAAASDGQVAALKERVAALKEHADAMFVPRLRNLSVQILLKAVGSGGKFRTSKSRHFENLATIQEGREKIALMAACFNETHDTVIRELDSLIGLRNISTHPPSLQAIDEEVQEVLKLVTPAVIAKCKWEYLVVVNFVAMKEFFLFE